MDKQQMINHELNHLVYNPDTEKAVEVLGRTISFCENEGYLTPAEFDIMGDFLKHLKSILAMKDDFSSWREELLIKLGEVEISPRSWAKVNSDLAGSKDYLINPALIDYQNPYANIDPDKEETVEKLISELGAGDYVDCNKAYAHSIMTKACTDRGITDLDTVKYIIREAWKLCDNKPLDYKE